jgi:hypothetical protein
MIERLGDGRLPYHIYQRLVRLPGARVVLSGLERITKPKLHGQGACRHAESIANKLRMDGFSGVLDWLDIADVSGLKAFLLPKPCGVHNVPVRDQPAGLHAARYPKFVLMHCPAVYRLANNPAVLRAVAGYFGCKPTLDTCDAWWHFPNPVRADHAMGYHRDVDSMRFVKMFVYLTDVSPGSSPHVYVKGSHRRNRLFGFGEIPDASVHAAFSESDIVTVHGRAGTHFITDAFGIHKAETATTGRRLIFSVLYTVTPTPYTESFFPWSDRSGIENATRMELDPYVNRLYLR